MTQYTVASRLNGRYPQLPAAIRDCSYARKSPRIKALYLGLPEARDATVLWLDDSCSLN